MARFRSNKRSKELQRKAKPDAKEARKRERREKAAEGVDDDIDWSQAVGITPPPGTVPSGAGAEESELDDEGAPGRSAHLSRSPARPPCVNGRARSGRSTRRGGGAYPSPSAAGCLPDP